MTKDNFGNQKILVIPDIHCMFAEAEAIISHEKPEQVIFLGDYFDRYDSEPTLTTKVARWLKGSLEQKNRVHLLGNHELWYATGNELMICSGNTELKFQAIRHEKIHWDKFKLHHWMNDWLITHAGLSKRYYDEYKKDCFSPNAEPNEFIGYESREIY
jgi:predicted MPP superfamily phosphohydrolase